MKLGNSNTTLVKVKFWSNRSLAPVAVYSNTTLVKVKLISSK